MSISFVRTAAAFVGAATPSDSNDGLDPIGLALVAATFTAATLTITDTSGLHKFLNARVGDWIYISSDTGATTTQVPLASVDPSGDFASISATGYVGDAPGDWTDQADVVTSSGPFATVSHLFSILNAGMVGRIVDDGHYLTAQLTSANSGTAGSEIVVERANVHGAADDTDRVRVGPNAAFVNNNLLVTLGSRSYWNFRNISFNSAPNGGGGTATGVTVGAHTFLVGCESSNSNGSGFLDGSGTGKFIRCVSHNNVTHGFTLSGGSALSCSAYANGSDGINVGTGALEVVVENCVSFANTGNGVGVNGGGYGSVIRSNTCAVNVSDGFDINSSQGGIVLTNNISQGNAGYGYKYNGGGAGVYIDIGNNQANGNILGDGDA